MERFVFDIETFCPSDGLDALKVLEEAAELEVAFKIWGGHIKDATYTTDYYHKKKVDQVDVEDELADVIIACANLAKKHGLSIEAGIARKNEANIIRGYAKDMTVGFPSSSRTDIDTKESKNDAC